MAGSNSKVADIKAKAAEGLANLAGDMAETGESTALATAEEKVKRHQLDLILSGDDPKWKDTATRRMDAALAGTGINRQSFAATVLNVVTTSPSLVIPKDPTLAEACYRSVLVAALNAAQLKLHPAPQAGQVWFVPFKTNLPADHKAAKDKRIQWSQVRDFPAVQLIVGYQGFYTLAYRSGAVKAMTAGFIWPGQDYDTDGLTYLKLALRPPGWVPADDAVPDYVYFMVQTIYGGTVLDVRPYSEVLAWRSYSPSWPGVVKARANGWKEPDSPWVKFEKQMVRKSLVRMNRHQLPLGDASNPSMTDFINAFAVDGTAAIGTGSRLPEVWEQPEWQEGGGGSLQYQADPVEVHGSVAAANAANADDLPDDALVAGLRARAAAGITGDADLALDIAITSHGAQGTWQDIVNPDATVSAERPILVALYKAAHL